MSPMMAVDLGLSFSSPSFSLFESSAPLVSSQGTSRTINLSNPSSLSRNSSSRVTCQISTSTETTTFLNKNTYSLKSKKIFSNIPRSSGSSSSEASEDGMKASNDKNKAPFGYSRKDVLLIGLGVTLVGIGLESGLEFVGVDPLKAGNAVQLVMVLGLTIGWISTYIFRVSNKDMTYAQQLRDYEYKVMEKRLEGLTEAEVQVLMEQVEEEKRSLASSEQVQ